MKRHPLLKIFLLTALLLPLPSQGEQSTPGEAFPAYQPASEDPSGSLRIVGASPAVGLPKRLALALQEQMPKATIQAQVLERAGETAWWGETDAVALFDNPMTEAQMAAFERERGHRPASLPIAMDAVAVIVHPDNPVSERGLILAELDALFSETRKRGHTEIRLWGDLGITGEWEDRPIRLYSPDVESGLFHYFKRQVLQDGEFKPGLTRLPRGSTEIIKAIGGKASDIQAVIGDLNGIGYVRLEALDSRVATVPLAADSGQPVVTPNPESVYEKRYPLIDYVYLYLDPASVTPLQQELLRFVFSREGQQLIAGTDPGYVPLPAQLVKDALRQSGLDFSMGTD